MFAIREKRMHVTQEDFEMAVVKVTKGVKRNRGTTYTFVFLIHQNTVFLQDRFLHFVVQKTNWLEMVLLKPCIELL